MTRGLRARCRQRMPMLLVRAVTQRQTDYRTFKKSLIDTLDHPVSRNWPSSSRLHQMKSDHEPACMCHLYRLRINTHVLTKDYVLSYRATEMTLIFSDFYFNTNLTCKEIFSKYQVCKNYTKLARGACS